MLNQGLAVGMFLREPVAGGLVAGLDRLFLLRFGGMGFLQLPVAALGDFRQQRRELFFRLLQLALLTAVELFDVLGVVFRRELRRCV